MLVKLGTLPIIPCLYSLGVSPHGMTLIGRAMHHELSKMKFFRGGGHYVRFLILFLAGFAIWIPATELIVSQRPFSGKRAGNVRLNRVDAGLAVPQSPAMQNTLRYFDSLHNVRRSKRAG